MTIQLKGGTYSIWNAVNPVLAERQVGLELDTGRYKVGDGTSTWIELPYFGLDWIQEQMIDPSIAAALAEYEATHPTTGTPEVFVQETQPDEGATAWYWVQLDEFGDVIGEAAYTP